MVEIPAGRFKMGSDAFYPEEAPVREVEVGSFLIDPGPVTVEQFGRFVDETCYVTLAEVGEACRCPQTSAVAAANYLHAAFRWG